MGRATCSSDMSSRCWLRRLASFTPEFTATSRITFSPHVEDDQVGLLVMGADYSYISVKKRPQGLVVSQIICKGADQGAAEVESTPVPLTSNTVYLRARVGQNAEVNFAYSTDGATFTDLGQPVTAVAGRWIGAKVGLFALGSVPVSAYWVSWVVSCVVPAALGVLASSK